MSDLPSRPYSSRLRARCLLASGLLAISGCSTTLPLLVGADKATPAPASATPPPISTTPFTWNNQDWAGSAFGGNDVVLPPTVPDQSPPEEPVPVDTRVEPHRAIATAPLTAQPADLAPFTEAAQHAKAANPDVRFVLLVLTPPAGSTPAIGQTATNAQSAADFAAQALAKAGVGPDRLAISGATSGNVGAGEMRLYVR